MIHTVITALLLAGSGTPATPSGAPTQPMTQLNRAPHVYFYTSSARSYLGVDIQDVAPDRMAALKLKEGRGVEVTMVDQDAPAGKAGLKEHDVILEFNGTEVDSGEQLRKMIREVPPGHTVNIGISRDGQPMKFNVQLADRDKISSAVRPKMIMPTLPTVRIPKIEPNISIQIQDRFVSSLGVETENLSRQLGDYFGVKDGEGILVRSVETGSPAEKGGLRAGDCIVRAGNERLSDQADLSHVVRSHRDGGKLSLGIVRDRHEQTIAIDLPAPESGDSSWRIFDPDDWDGLWQKMEQEFQDQDWQRMEQRLRNLEEIKEIRPRIEEATREARAELRRAQRSLEKANKDLRHRL